MHRDLARVRRQRAGTAPSGMSRAPGNTPAARAPFVAQVEQLPPNERQAFDGMLQQRPMTALQNLDQTSAAWTAHMLEQLAPGDTGA